MNDKLPDFVEEWIAQTTVTMQLNPKYLGVLEDDLRAFLSKFVLCGKKPAGFINKTTGDVLSAGIVDNARLIKFAGYNVPLHAPATEVPE